MWIKICGNTNLEDARFAAECGADALGFVFAPSPRRVNTDTVRQITAKLPTKIETYGVFVDAAFDEIVSAVTTCGLTGVQLHRCADSSIPSRLRQRLGKISILSVLHYQGPDFEQRLRERLMNTGQDGELDAVLVDSSIARVVGGSGVSFSWAEARSAFLGAGRRLRLIAAGGLSPENVKQAIQTLQPWGVDVVSGVESAPGKKDPARVLAFIRSAQEADLSAAEARVASRG
jgi:phosphoribosylanthranilate isomerase